MVRGCFRVDPCPPLLYELEVGEVKLLLTGEWHASKTDRIKWDYRVVYQILSTLKTLATKNGLEAFGPNNLIK